MHRQLGEFAERMTTFMAFKVVSSPTSTSHHSFLSRWLCLYRQLRNRDAILHQILIGALETNGQLDVLILHNKQFFELLLITSPLFNYMGAMGSGTFAPTFLQGLLKLFPSLSKMCWKAILQKFHSHVFMC